VVWAGRGRTEGHSRLSEGVKARGTAKRREAGRGAKRKRKGKKDRSEKGQRHELACKGKCD
jgi:hypothetical protein